MSSWKLWVVVLALLMEGMLALWETEQRARLPKPSVDLILTYPSGASVAFDEQPVGTALTPCKLEGGDFHQVTLRKPGYDTERLDSAAVKERVIELRPLWWLVLARHTPGLVAMLALLAHLASRPQPPPTPRSKAAPPASEKPRPIERRASGFVPMPGQSWGPYTLKEKLGQGSMAEVWLGESADGRQAAVKILHRILMDYPDFADKFLHEAEICSHLNHPGVVSVLNHGELNGRLWMAQEYVPGASLEHLPLPLPPTKAIPLLIEICRALSYAHSCGVVHHDLKLSNLLLREDARPVIADFGLARYGRYETRLKKDAVIGTPAYMSPEQIQGEHSDSRADLYSLGCIAYELLTGSTPFVHDDPQDMLIAQLTALPPRPKGVSPALETILMRLLAKHPQDRYQTAEEVRILLEAALAPRPQG